MAAVAVLDQMTLQSDKFSVQVFGDSDWAGCPETRRSTSGQVEVVGGIVVHCSSITQPGVPAGSSGEAETRVLTDCCKQGIFLYYLLTHDFGVEAEIPRIWTDSSAALQLSKRLGVGKLRHISVQELMCQQWAKEKRVIIGKVDGK